MLGDAAEAEGAAGKGRQEQRAADLEAASLLLPPAAIGDLPAGELPDGAAALIHISSRGVRVHLGTEARAAGLL